MHYLEMTVWINEGGGATTAQPAPDGSILITYGRAGKLASRKIFYRIKASGTMAKVSVQRSDFAIL